MEFVDTHCHLDFAEFDSNRKGIIKRAMEKNIRMVSSGVDFQGNIKNLEIAKKFSGVYLTLGLSPTRLNQEEAEKVFDLIQKHKKEIVGIGEVGLDYYWEENREKREFQKEIFSKFIQLSKKLSLPLVIHSRSAGKYALQMLEEAEAKNVILHCFDGAHKYARRAVDRGYLISVPTIVTSSEFRQEQVENIPLDNLVLETDSPYLGPVRGEINEPANVIAGAEKIAELKGITLKEVAQITSANAKKFFRII